MKAFPPILVLICPVYSGLPLLPQIVEPCIPPTISRVSFFLYHSIIYINKIHQF